MVKNPPASAGDMGLIPRSGRSPGEGNGNPFQYSCQGKSHGQRTLECYSPQNCKRIRHNLVTKQQQCIAYAYDLFLSTYLPDRSGVSYKNAILIDIIIIIVSSDDLKTSSTY